MAAMKIKIKEEPPDDELSAILDNGIQLSSVDKEAEGLITQQIEEILPNEDDEEEEEEEEEEEGQELPKRKFPCRYCDFKAKTKKELGRHEARHAIKGWYHECQYCDYVTHIRQRLQEHESKHTNTKPFKCEKCEFRTRFKADLYKHRAKHSTVKKYSCPQCDFRTKWCRNIKHHLLKHTEERPHCCDICGFKFKRIQDLKYHLYRHNDVKPIQCELCEFRCKTNYELKCHRLKHSNIKNFSCTFPGCTQKTKTKSDLTKHMRTHNKDNSYLCSICGKGFNTLTSLNKHKDRHSNVRKFKCGLCEKWFKNKPSLRAHMKIHSGIKPFQCDVCLRYFLNKYNMHKHKETHTGDRPYLCPICPYGARISDHLLAHIGSMHGDSHAYFCELCRKPFKRYSQLQVHIKRMHKDVQNFDRDDDGKIDIKLESGADGVISTGSDVFSVKKIGDCHFEPEVKKKRGRPPKNKIETPTLETAEENSDPKLLKPVQIKQEKVPPEESIIKLATYDDGFRLPLATKGFQFNFDKTGKKPRSWFMQPENMHGNAAVKQRAYMAKKERYFDRLNSGRIQRVRKRSDVVYNGLNMLTRATAQKVCGINDTQGDKYLLEKDLEPHRLLITGRTKLKTMRKIKRRIRNMKASLKGSPLLNDPVPASEIVDGGSKFEGGDVDDEETVEVSKYDDDDDDVPLSKLRAVDGSESFSRVPLMYNSPSRSNDSANKRKKIRSESKNTENCPKSSNDFGSESGHIKLVLKRRKEGTFKVTLNTSAQVPHTSSSGLKETTMKKTPSLASDVYNGSVRILGKSLQSKSNSSPSKTNKMKNSAKDGTKETKSVISKKKPKNSVVNKRSRKQKSLKANTYKNKNKLQKLSKVVKGKQKETKSKRTNVTKSNSSRSKTNKVKKAPNNPTNGKPKSKQTKPNIAQTKPKGKKKNLICSIGVAKGSTKPNSSRRQRRFLQHKADEEFPIKIEPADDDYESSLKNPVSGAFMDVDLIVSASTLVKVETCSQEAEHFPSCLGSSNCSCATSVLKKEYESEPECKYLYDVKCDVNVDESYNEHAIAWGLHLDSQGVSRESDRSKNLMLKSSYCIGKKHAQETVCTSTTETTRGISGNSTSILGTISVLDGLSGGGSEGADLPVTVTEFCETGFSRNSLVLKSSPLAKGMKRSNLELPNVKIKLDGETPMVESVYCWGTSVEESEAKDSVLPNTTDDSVESYPLDLRLSRKIELYGKEADQIWMDSSETQDKVDGGEKAADCPVSYTYTF